MNFHQYYKKAFEVNTACSGKWSIKYFLTNKAAPAFGTWPLFLFYFISVNLGRSIGGANRTMPGNSLLVSLLQ